MTNSRRRNSSLFDYLPVILVLIVRADVVKGQSHHGASTLPSGSINTIPKFDPNANMDNLQISEDTPVGSVIYTLRGIDPDPNATLTLGVSGEGSDVVQISNSQQPGRHEAKVRLIRKLDREAHTSHLIRLTLTDGIISKPIIHDSTLYVGDENDETPQFIDYNTTYYVSENAPPGTVIGTLSARDKDQGIYGMIRFDELDNAKTFKVETLNANTGTGRIILVGPLDYETQPMFQLRIIAMDGTPALQRVNTATLGVVVQVLDTQDTPPHFIIYPSVQYVPENVPIGKEVFNVLAQDGDRGIPKSIQYSLQPATSPFAIDPQSGVVYVSQLLDREANMNGGTMVVTVVATELPVTPGMSASVQVSIIIEDVNDHPPQFYNGVQPTDTYSASIPENAAVGALVNMDRGTTPRVFDPDQGINGSFALSITGDAAHAFDITPSAVINEALFMIRVKNSTYLDFETTKLYHFTIVARETGTPEKYSSTASVTVTILDVNDHIPVFRPDYYEVHMKENAPTGTLVLRVQAHDSDSGEQGVISYNNLQGKYADHFVLDAMTGDIRVSSTGEIFDREVIPEMFLTVEARDSIGKGHRATAQIRIILDDINDKRPVFGQDIYEATLIENQMAFLRPLVVHATDRDDTKTGNGKVTYAIARSKYSDHFVISVTGEITVAKPLNYEDVVHVFNESSGVLDIQIVAFDSGEPPLSASCLARVFVQDENDHAPRFLQNHYTGIVAENAAMGTAIVTVSAVDNDKSNLYGRVVYRIERGAQDKFVIDAQSGVIAVASGANLDRDVQSAYDLKVVALDGGFGTDQKTGTTQVTITITDINNKPPVFPTFPTIDVNETTPVGSTILRIQANDPDHNAHLTYTLVDVTDALSESLVPVRKEDFNYTTCFAVRPDGVLYVAAPLDRELFETVQVTVRAEDTGSETGRQTAVTTVKIRVVDVNDNPPHFIFPMVNSGEYYENSVIENFVPTSPMFHIVASDKDKSRTIKYSIENLAMSVQTFFKINPETGEITLLKPLDREQFDWINFTARATDSGIPPLFSIAPVYLYVIDVNDNNPNFTFAPSDVTVREDVQIGQEVTTVRAVDPDSGPYGHVSYTLDPSTAFGKFVIDKDTGTITVAGRLDREERNSYALVVNAVDDFQNGFNRASRKSSKTIRIAVEDVNDNAPIINTDDLSDCIRLIETDGAGTQFYTIRATDLDQPFTPTSEIRFKAIGGNGSKLFDVSHNHGALMTTVALNNKYGNYTLDVEAHDQGFPSLATNRTFHICVEDFNDNAPVFVHPIANESVAVWENATVGTKVVQVQAVDNDIGDNAVVKYSFLTDQNHDYQTFELDRNTGWITLIHPLDRERQKQYTLFVDAHDLGVPQRNTLQRFIVRVIDINDNEPIFRVARQEFHVVENYPPGSVIGKVAEAFDEDGDVEHTQTCYFIVAGNTNKTFTLEKHSREIRLLASLDREQFATYELTIKASSNCSYLMPGAPIPLTTKDHSLMQAIVIVDDVNDNRPRFPRKEYTAGVTVESKYGTRVTKLTAIDPDDGENGVVTYAIEEPININLNKEDSFRDPPFTIDKQSGEVFLNVKFSPDMKGYFDFTVMAEDRSGFNDTARLFIYLLRADQRVQFTLLGKPEDVRIIEDELLETLSNITGARANIDDVVTHIDDSGTVNERLSDVLMHFVDPTGKIMDVDTIIALIDQTYDRLETAFKAFNIIEVQRAIPREPLTNETTVLKALLIGITLGLLLLLILSAALFCSQRSRYTRKLRAATALAFSSSDSTAGLHPTEVPGTNLHSYEGSNPVWMNSYVEKWTKDTESDGKSSSSVEENSIPEELGNGYEEQVRKTTFFGDEARVLKGVSPEGSGKSVVKEVHFGDLVKRRTEQQTYNNIYETIEDKEGKYIAKLESTEL